MAENLKEMANSVPVFCSASQNEIVNINRWLIPSLTRQNKIASIKLFIVNYSGKGKVYNGKGHVEKVEVQEIVPEKSVGFGEAHNFAFEKVRPEDYFLIINPDIYLHENALFELIKTMESNQRFGIVEARQLPFEHPKEYDEKTGETPWASGSCILVRSQVFKQIGGFDEKFWMYCEDVDLSWRVWLDGYKVIYSPKAVAYHFTGNYFGYNSSRYYHEHFWSSRNFLYIMYKYWGKDGETRALDLFNKTVFPEYFKQEVIKSFNHMKSNLSMVDQRDSFNLSRLKEKIKVIGFNQYHAFRK